MEYHKARRERKTELERKNSFFASFFRLFFLNLCKKVFLFALDTTQASGANELFLYFRQSEGNKDNYVNDMLEFIWFSLFLSMVYGALGT